MLSLVLYWFKIRSIRKITLIFLTIIHVLIIKQSSIDASNNFLLATLKKGTSLLTPAKALKAIKYYQEHENYIRNQNEAYPTVILEYYLTKAFFHDCANYAEELERKSTNRKVKYPSYFQFQSCEKAKKHYNFLENSYETLCVNSGSNCQTDQYDSQNLAIIELLSPRAKNEIINVVKENWKTQYNITKVQFYENNKEEAGDNFKKMLDNLNKINEYYPSKREALQREVSNNTEPAFNQEKLKQEMCDAYLQSKLWLQNNIKDQIGIEFALNRIKQKINKNKCS